MIQFQFKTSPRSDDMQASGPSSTSQPLKAVIVPKIASVVRDRASFDRVCMPPTDFEDKEGRVERFSQQCSLRILMLGAASGSVILGGPAIIVAGVATVVPLDLKMWIVGAVTALGALAGATILRLVTSAEAKRLDHLRIYK
jgi:hypothetical protein